MPINFEFGRTTASDAFFNRHPRFWPACERVIAVVNKCFGREYKPTNDAESICFELGQRCRDDFFDVLFLAVHGHALGATKLLRGLYERAVTIAYIVKHPNKGERFMRYAAIQDHKLLEATLKVVPSEERFDAEIPTITVAQIRERYRAVKPEFQETICKKCGKSRTAASWDLDLASMVHKVGEPFEKCYLAAYTIPTLQIHATAASAFAETDSVREADLTLFHATVLLLAALRSQNQFFSLDLDDEIAACEIDAFDVWVQPDKNSQPN